MLEFWQKFRPDFYLIFFVFFGLALVIPSLLFVDFQLTNEQAVDRKNGQLTALIGPMECGQHLVAGFTNFGNTQESS